MRDTTLEMKKDIMIHEDEVRRREDELQELNNYYEEIKNSDDLDEITKVKNQKKEIIIKIMKLDAFISGTKYVISNLE